jgi:acetyl-CoA carboxylase biotin carboxyl carrier protein
VRNDEGVSTEARSDWSPVLEATSRTAACLAAALGGAALRRIRVQSGDTCVEVTWSADAVSSAAGAAPDGEVPDVDVERPATPGAHYVCSPMVGAFFHATTPDAQPFVTVGDVITPGQQIGIIEAMKFMNRVEATEAGRVLEVLVPNGASVEYGTQLLALAPL